MRPHTTRLLLLTALLVWGSTVLAAPSYRYLDALRGNLSTTGNTLGLAGGTNGPSTNDGIGVFTDASSTLQVPGWPLGTTLDWTLASSTGVLDLPAGATILHAELVWAGTVSASVLGSLDAPVLFSTPSGVSHEVAPLATTASPSGGTMADSGYYGRSADVTDLVEAAGTYRVGRVPSSLSGTDAAAGWALFVVYGAATEPPRRIAIATVMEDTDLAPNADLTVDVAGLCIPTASSNRYGRVALASLDGDASVTGETLRYARQTSQLGDGGSRIAPPGATLTNPLISRIAGNNGEVDTRGTFGTTNHGTSNNVSGGRQGFDLTNIDTTVALATNWTNALFRPNAGDDLHSMLAVAMVVRHRTPLLIDTGAVIAVTPTAATVGTVLTVTVTLQNSGDATAAPSTFTMPVPAGLSYVASSFTFNGAFPPGGAVTAQSALASGITLPAIGDGSTALVRLQFRVDGLPQSVTLAPRVSYENQACAGAPVIDTFDPRLVPAILFSQCGNGRLESGEVCDDGDVSGQDGCSATCTQEVGYTCQANPGGNGTPQNPDSRCLATCGDGVLAVGAEQCDDGDLTALDGCGPGCQIEYGWVCSGPAGASNHCTASCGDGRLARNAESCDDGNQVAGDGCESCQRTPGWVCVDRQPGSGTQANPDTTCATVCGDGLLGAPRERCDDGDTLALDGCGPSCFVEYGWVCPGLPGTAAHCVSVCGDGQLAKNAEACDDGDTQPGDGCGPNCQPESGWVCTDRAPGSGSQVNPDTQCETTCGDGIAVAPFEVCDDNNTNDGDGCSATCTAERGWTCLSTCQPTACGDGVRALPAEGCDDGNTMAGDGCSPACEPEVGFDCEHTADDTDLVADSLCDAICGNGLRAASEGCDDGNSITGDGCSASCELEAGWTCIVGIGQTSVCRPLCGDGLIRGDEVCDDNNEDPNPRSSGDEPDGCAFDCSAVDFGWSCDGEPSVCVTTCGDGLVGLMVEACDDGNLENGDGCAFDCALVETGWSCGDPVLSPSVCEPLCGDGLVRGVEGCDDGDNNDGDGCSADCRVEERWDCDELDVDQASICYQDSDGDGVFDDGDRSGDPNDNPCEVGVPVVDGACDDNCPNFPNADQGYPDRPTPLCPPYDGPRTQGGGGGCVGGGLAWWGLLPLLWVRRRGALRWVLGASVLITGTSGLMTKTAHAQEVDPRSFSGALSPHAVLGVETSAIGRHLAPFFGLSSSYANDEVITRVSADGTARGPLRERFVATLYGGLALWSRLEVALGVPLMVSSVSRGGLAVGTGSNDGEVGLGDLRLVVRGRLFGPSSVRESGFGLGLVGELGVPVGGGTFKSDGGLSSTMSLVADWRNGYGHVVALNAGFRVRPEVAIDDLMVDDEVRFGLGAELALGAAGELAFAFLGEVGVGLGLGDSAFDDGGLASREVQVEALGGLKVRAPDVTAHVAAGAGLSEGYGAPDFRVVFGVSFLAEVPATRDEPLVPLLLMQREDPWDEAQKTAVILPARSGAPVPAEVFDAIVLADPDTDSDGVMIPTDACPDEPEDRDGFADEDGCPDPDNDGDGILDAADKCPTSKEVFNGVDDEDGCPDEGAALLTKEGDVLKIPDRIKFKSGSAELLPSDKAILDPVAAALSAMGGTLRIRIEGHTDNEGDREFNVDLAERRAWSVRAYLMEKGVAGERLFAKGFGPTRPVASNQTDVGRAQNRRVEFHVIKPGERLEGDVR